MTKTEKHEISVVLDAIVNDECNEISERYMKLYRDMKDYKAYIRKELVAFWSDCEPYLETHYLDYATIDVGKRIINYDDAWCFVRDGLQDAIDREIRRLEGRLAELKG